MNAVRGYCLTINNYTDDDVAKLDNLINNPRPLLAYVVYGKEIAPSTHTPHLQCYIYFKNQVEFSSVKKLFPSAHIEPQKGTPKQASDYCKEDGDWKEYGTLPENGHRTDLDIIYKKVIDGEDLDNIILENPDAYNRCHKALHKIEDIQLRKNRRQSMTEGEWIFGGTGLGKSEYAFQFPDSYVYPYDNGWWDGYKQQDIVVIDEFRGQLPFNELLRMVDKHPNYFVRRRCREPMPFISKKVIITSSLPPWQVYKNLPDNDNIKQLFRRFKIYELKAQSQLQEITYEEYENLLDGEVVGK